MIRKILMTIAKRIQSHYWDKDAKEAKARREEAYR